MARFDLHQRPGRLGGYVVDVQADLLSDLQTRVVVPLFPSANWSPVMDRLNPVFAVAGEPHVFVAQSIAAVPRRELGPAVGSVAEHRDEITLALDILLTGF